MLMPTIIFIFLLQVYVFSPPVDHVSFKDFKDLQVREDCDVADATC